MRWLFVVTAFLRLAAAFGADPAIRLPAGESIVVPQDITQIGGASVYVIEADIPAYVLSSRDGLVSVLVETGPMKIRGIFADGTKVETRTYTAKHLFIVEPVGKGEVELFVVPAGAKTADAVVRKILTVSGEGPRPPPKPVPPTPGPSDVTLGLIVFDDIETRGPDTARLLTSTYWQTLSARHRVAVYTRKTSETTGKAFLAETAGATGPTLLIRDNTANKKLDVVPLPKSSEDFEVVVKKWSTK